MQIVLNYYDYDEPFIQARACYDVIVKHGCQVVIMEPVKGGALANVPLAVLSGMSNLAQVEDNTSYMQDFKPITKEELEVLDYTKQEMMKKWKYQCDDMSKLDDNPYHVPLSSIIRGYNSLLIQPNPYFGAELNYYKSFRSAYDRAYETENYSELTEAIDHAFDVNAALKEAIEFQTKYSFQGYVED